MVHTHIHILKYVHLITGIQRHLVRALRLDQKRDDRRWRPFPLFTAAEVRFGVWSGHAPRRPAVATERGRGLLRSLVAAAGRGDESLGEDPGQGGKACCPCVAANDRCGWCGFRASRWIQAVSRFQQGPESIGNLVRLEP